MPNPKQNKDTRKAPVPANSLPSNRDKGRQQGHQQRPGFIPANLIGVPHHGTNPLTNPYVRSTNKKTTQTTAKQPPKATTKEAPRPPWLPLDTLPGPTTQRLPGFTTPTHTKKVAELITPSTTNTAQVDKDSTPPDKPRETEQPTNKDTPVETIPDQDPEQEAPPEQNDTDENQAADVIDVDDILDEALAHLQFSQETTNVQTAFAVPENSYKYNPDINLEVSTSIRDKLNEHTVFEEATQTLTPHKELTLALHKIRGTMQGCSLANDNHAKTLTKITDNKNFIHKSVRVKATLQIPYGAADFPDLLTIYKGISNELIALNAEYKARGTALITQCLRVGHFQNRISKSKLLITQLIHQVAQYHVDFYRMENEDSFPTEADNPSKHELDLAITAVYLLTDKFDLELLEYLDINRKQLQELSLTLYKPNELRDYNRIDKNAIYFAIDTMLGYLKVITCVHYKTKKATSQTKSSAARIAAKMEAALAHNAMAAINDCISTQAAALPKNSKSLENTVNEIVDKRENNASKRKKHPKPLPPTILKKKKNDSTGRRPAKQTPSHRNNNDRTNNGSGHRGKKQKTNHTTNRKVSFDRKPRGGS